MMSTSRRGRVLFVGHSANRSGAPIILLDFLKWLRANTDIEFDVAVVEGGPLVSDFAALADTRVLREVPSLGQRITRRVVGHDRYTQYEDRRFLSRVLRRGYDVAYVNTVAPKRELLALAALGLPVICHVHELEFSIRYWLGNEGLTPLIPSVARFIAASEAVGQELADRWAVPASKIIVVNEFTTGGAGSANSRSARERVRRSLGLSDDNLLVGGCGTFDWRKGADLFLQLVRLVASDPNAQHVRFAWLGADRQSLHYHEAMYDIERCGLKDRVSLLESTPTPADVFAAMDIFALTSREDPFPLVMLEAAAMEVPMICFGKSGGGPEFAAGGAGIVVPYLDVRAFASEVARLADDAERRRAIGKLASKRVADCFTIDRQAPKLRDVIQAYTR
jgi:glycosyltransferase involved in cell wall biosynthesis